MRRKIFTVLTALTLFASLVGSYLFFTGADLVAVNYPTLVEARRAAAAGRGAFDLPAFLPADARRVRAAQDRKGGGRWISLQLDAPAATVAPACRPQPARPLDAAERHAFRLFPAFVQTAQSEIADGRGAGMYVCADAGARPWTMAVAADGRSLHLWQLR